MTTIGDLRSVDFETSGMDYLNGLNRRLVELHREIVAACAPKPKTAS